MPEVDEQKDGFSGIRVETVREATFDGLAALASSGGLTLDEYAERAVAVEQAATVDELNAAVHGLPERDAAVGSLRFRQIGGRMLT